MFAISRLQDCAGIGRGGGEQGLRGIRRCPMMEPIVRLMVPCEDARIRKGTRSKVDILGVITTIGAPSHAFPVRLTFSVYLCLTNGHGSGSGKITIAADETDALVFDGEPRPFDFGNDPTALFGSTITIPM